MRDAWLMRCCAASCSLDPMCKLLCVKIRVSTIKLAVCERKGMAKAGNGIANPASGRKGERAGEARRSEAKRRNRRAKEFGKRSVL